jgi:hypothetical protein
MTKREMAKVVVQALYNLKSLPSDDSISVKRLCYQSKTNVEWAYVKARKILDEK